MKHLISIILVLLTVFFISCKSNELTREKAKELILAKASFPTTEKGEFQSSSYNALVGLDVPKFEKLKQAGVITYNHDGWYLTAEFTDLGKTFIMGPVTKGNYADKFVDVKTAEINFGEVTGIKSFPEQNMAEVTYTINKKLTPFGLYLFNQKDGLVNKKATFQKYDDGWRLDKIK